MDDIEEKRVYGDRAGGSELLVAAAMGLVSVEVAADRVGRFGVVHRCAPQDVAAAGGLVAVATDEDVLVRESGAEDFTATGFGPAEAVGIAGGDAVATGSGGDVARLDSAGNDFEWSRIGTLDPDVRAIDPPLLATSDGVYRLPGLDYVGLDDAYDVAAAGPLAATAGGLYSLGNGWMDEIDGDFRVVATDGRRAHAATREAFFDRSAGEWREVDLPAEGAVVDVAYADVPYAVTQSGVLLAEGEAGWREHPLGLEGVVRCAVA